MGTVQVDQVDIFSVGDVDKKIVKEKFGSL